MIVNAHFQPRGLSAFCFVWILAAVSMASAQSPVDRSQPLNLVSSDFGLADGPSWNGWSLFVPDVKQALIKQYIPGKDEWRVLSKGPDKVSASFFSHGKLWVSNNSAARIQTYMVNRRSDRPHDVFIIDDSEKPKKRPNDLVVDEHGGVYFTLTRQNQVVYVSPNGRTSRFSDVVVSPNGITISPDNSTLYVAAYKPKKIIAIAIESPGVAGADSEFAAMDDGEALGADGMTIDRAGNVYCAGPKDVWIWSPAGDLLDRIACPTRPINCTFGGKNMRTLYIAGFGGLYEQAMKINGVSPEPAQDKDLVSGKDMPDTSVTDDLVIDRNVVYATYGTRRMLADVIRPRTSSHPLPAVVVVHGGGWLNGDKTKFRALALELARRGFIAAAIEYRLGGEAAFPAAMHDCSAAVRFLRANADQYGIDGDRIAAVGGSAGGHLAGLMAAGSGDERLHGKGGHSVHSSRIQLAIVMAGPMAIASGSVAERSGKGKTSNATNWIGASIDEDRDSYLMADAYQHISQDTCPIFFMTGELDHPERNAESRDRLAELGIATGVMVYSKGKHGCWNREPWFALMVDDMERLLRTHL